MSDVLIPHVVAVDWVGFSFKGESRAERVKSWLHTTALDLILILGSPLSSGSLKIANFEGYAYDWPCGKIFAGYSHKEGMGIVQIQSGLAWEYCDNLVMPEDILSFAVFNRIDIQVTTVSGGLMRDRMGSGYGYAKLMEYGQGLDQIRLGSKSSQRMWRVYQKVDSDGVKYTRYEVQLNKRLAREVGKQMMISGRNGQYGYARLYKGEYEKMRKKVKSGNHMVIPDGDNEQIEECLENTKGVLLRTVKKKRSTTLSWLYDSMIPAIVKLVEVRPDEISAFMNALADAYNAEVNRVNAKLTKPD